MIKGFVLMTYLVSVHENYRHTHTHYNNCEMTFACYTKISELIRAGAVCLSVSFSCKG